MSAKADSASFVSKSRYGGTKRTLDRKFRLRKNLVKAGAVFEQTTLKKIEFGTTVAELVIGLDKNHTVSVAVDLDTLLECPEWFEEVA